MPGVFTVGFDDIQVAAAQDLILLRAPPNGPIILHEITMDQRGLEAGAEGKPLRLYSVSGSPTITGGITVTPVPNNRANDFRPPLTTCLRNMTTVFAGGSAVLLRPAQFRLLIGFFYYPLREDRFQFDPFTYMILQLPAAPSGAMNVSLALTFEEA